MTCLPHQTHASFSNKAVSDGAISFYLDHFVRTRVSKVTYGNFCHIPFEPSQSDHQQRIRNTFISVSGSKRISDAFDVILPKVNPYLICSWHLSLIYIFFFAIRIHKWRKPKNSGRHTSVNQRRKQISTLQNFSFGVTEDLWKSLSGRTRTHVRLQLYPWYVICGSVCFTHAENYTKLCTINVDLSHLPLVARPKVTGPGLFYRLDYEIVLLFGLTELKAQVAWKEKQGMKVCLRLWIS